MDSDRRPSNLRSSNLRSSNLRSSNLRSSNLRSSNLRLGHLPALDGLRGVAVSAVFLFHAGLLDGGFIGVDVFFVVSGFLITALAITEIEQRGRLGLGAFWARRARRLLPAVFLLCGVVVIVSAVLGGGAARRVGREVVSTLAYVANWTQVDQGRDYFATYETPSLLEHTWSLAIEEQFYVVWPLVIVGVAWAARRTSRSFRVGLGVVATTLAAASVALSWWLAADGVRLNRLYFGTDTRAVGLALGAAAACVLAKGTRTGDREVRRVETFGALCGAVALGLLAMLIDGGERWLYGPGFLAVAAASLVVVTAASGAGPVQRALSVRPLVAVGRVSYGVYLWHWPVIAFLNAERTGLSGPSLGALWILSTGVLTVASWTLIEQRSRPPTLAHPVRTLAYVGAALIVALGATATVSAERAGRPEVAIPSAPSLASVPAEAEDNGEAPDTADPNEAVANESGVEAVVDPVLAPAEERLAEEVDPAVVTGSDTMPPRALPEDRPARVLILGDSVAASLNPVPDEPLEVEGYGSLELRNDAAIACPVLRVGVWLLENNVRLDDPESCLGDDRFADAVAEFEPDVIFMLFGWPALGGGRRLDDGTEWRPCDPEFDQAWVEEYELLARRFEEVTEVVVSTVAPPATNIPEQSLGANCLTELLVQQDLAVFDYSEWICPGGDCSEFGSLRPDAVHFDRTDDVRLGVLEALMAAALSTAGFAPAANG